MQVIVVGAGIWGLACAYACAKRGDIVRIYEAGSVGEGASGGVVGALAPHVPDQWNAKKQFQFEALDSAQNFWNEIDRLSNQESGFGRIGRLQPIVSEKALELAAVRSTSAQKLWQGKYHWCVRQTPGYLSNSTAPFGVVHDTLSARIFPKNATLSLAAACRKIGVEIIENHPIQHLSNHTVTGFWGADKADAIIVSAGVNGFEILSPFTRRLAGKGVKGQAALLDVNLGSHPQIFADGIYIIPHTNGTAAVGSTSENTWVVSGTDEKLDTVIAKAREIYPALKRSNVLQRWSGIRPKARRRDPMLGTIPELEGAFLALGAFKIGFGLSHKIGEVVAAQIHREPVDIPESFTFEWHMAK